MAALPSFLEVGVLPQGDYELTLEELRESHLVENPDHRCYPNWDSKWRARLVDNLEVLTRELWAVGIGSIYVDGSFVEDKNHPNDIDGYFDCDIDHLASGELEKALNLINEHKIWTWRWQDRISIPGESKPQLPMWVRYRVELYPHYGQLTGIKDEFDNELEFPAAFRKSRQDHKPKGIIKLVKGA